MKRSFIFLGCLLSFVVLQTGSLLADCGCGKKKPINKEIFFLGGCGCEGGGGNGSNEIPPDRE